MRWNSIRSEISCSNFGLHIHKPEAFCECQWRWPAPVYLMYRLVTLVYAGFALTESIVSWLKSHSEHHILVFMTIWTYILLTAYFLMGAILALVYFLYKRHFQRKPQSLALKANQRGKGSWIVRRLSRQKVNPASPSAARIVNVSPDGDAAGDSTQDRQPRPLTDTATNRKELNGRSEVKRAFPSNGTTTYVRSQSGSSRAGSSSPSDVGLPCYIQVYWLLGNIVQVWAVTITIIYFAAVFPDRPDHSSVSLHDVNVHILNTGFMLLDAMLGARPVRVLHVIYPIFYGIAYIIFSVIYWSRDPNYNVIYKVLDWNRPGLTVGVVCGLALLGLPLLQLVFFAAFKLRLTVYRHVYKEDYFQD